MVDGDAKLSIKGELYDYADLEYVMDDAYLSGVLGGGNNNESADKSENTDNSGNEDETK